MNCACLSAAVLMASPPVFGQVPIPPGDVAANAAVRALAAECRAWQFDGDQIGARLDVACRSLGEYVANAALARNRDRTARMAAAYRQAATSLLAAIQIAPDDTLVGRSLATVAFGETGLIGAIGQRPSFAAYSEGLLLATRWGNRNREAVRGCAAMALSVRDYPAARYCLHTGVTTDDREWHALRLAWLSARARLLTEAAEWVDLAARDANAGSDGWRSSEFAWLVSFLARHVGSRESSFPLRNKDLIGEVIEAARPEERLPNLVTAIFGDLPSSMDSVGAAMRDWLDYRGPSLRECIIGPSAGGDGTRRCETGLAHAGDPMRDEIPGTMVELWDEAGQPIVLAALQTGSQMPSAQPMIGIRRWSRSAPAMLLDTVVAAPPIRSSGEGWLVRLHGGDLLTSWSLRLNVPGLPTGWASRDEHAVGDLGRERLSDLMLAQPDRAVVYQAAHEPVLVPLDDELHRRVPAELFFQIRSAAADSATMSLTIVREGHRPGERELAISERVELPRGLREVRRSLDLRELESGWYALEVAIAFDQGGSARRTVRFRVR